METLGGLIDGAVAALHVDDSELALRYLKAALALAPNDGEVLSLHGLALSRAKRFDEAEPFLLRAVAQEPDQLGFRIHLAQHFEATEQFDRAMREFQAVVSADATRKYAWASMARITTLRRDWPALERMCEDWVRAHPQSIPAWQALCRALFEQGRFVEAYERFDRFQATGPRTAESLSIFAQICLSAAKLDAAAAALDEAEQLDPAYAEMLAAKGRLLTYRGRFEEAETYCRRCLAANPEHSPTYTFLCQLTRGRLSGAEMDVLRRILDREEASIDIRIPAAYALAHAYDARNDIDLAFAAYEKANALCAARNSADGASYDRALCEARTQSIINRFGAMSDLIGVSPRGLPQPIFIVGMPRSGTTLIESVLAAHSRVFAAGELPAMRNILKSILRTSGRLTPAALDKLTADYLSVLPDIGGADYVTDKQPFNFEALGLISKMFPDSPVVHVRRNPLETGFSIFRQEFLKTMPFANDLGDIGHAYGQYARLIAYWEKALGARFVTIQYEDFVTNFETAAPALVAHCGLEWEEACNDFQMARRDILTISAVQAREPLSVRRGKADAYARRLAPLKQALERQQVDLHTGALRAAH